MFMVSLNCSFVMFPCLSLSKSLMKSDTLILFSFTVLLNLDRRSLRSSGAWNLMVALLSLGLYL